MDSSTSNGFETSATGKPRSVICATAVFGEVSFQIGKSKINGIRARYRARLHRLHNITPFSERFFRFNGNAIQAACDGALSDLRTALVI